MRHPILTIAFLITGLLTANPLLGQQLEFDWARTMGGTGNEYPQASTTGPSGNLYITGKFEGTVNFNPGPDTLNISSNGGEDFFIKKMSPSGDLLWVAAIGSESDEQAGDIATDSSGNIYITGEYRDTVDFNPGSGTKILKTDVSSCFLLKLTPSGRFGWVKSIHSGTDTTGIANGRGVAAGGSGNVYLTGDFTGSVDFNPNEGEELRHNNGIHMTTYDMFVEKFDTSGNFQWVRTFGSNHMEYGRAITVDNAGGVYTTGTFKGTVDFNPGSGTTNKSSTGDDDIYVHKLSAEGNFRWVNTIGSTSNDRASAILSDSSNNIYVAGAFQDTVDFDPGSGVRQLASKGDYDVFVEKFNNTGEFQWVNTMGGSAGNDNIEAMTKDQSGNLYITGSFDENADLDPGAGIHSLSSNGDYDVFVEKMGMNGNFDWAYSTGGTEYDDGRAISTYGREELNVYVSGYFHEQVDFDPGHFSSASYTSEGDADIFTKKLSSVTATGVGVDSSPDSHSVYPNPTQGEVSVDLGKPYKGIEVEVRTLTGRKVTDKSIGSSKRFDMHIPGAPGYYLLKITTEDGYSTTVKVLKD